MVKRITELTQAQSQRMGEWRDKWIKIGLSCDPMTDRERRETEASIRQLYRKANFEQPKVVIFVPSPFALRCAAGIASGAIFAMRNGIPGYREHNKAVDTAVRTAVRTAVGTAVGTAVDTAVRTAVGTAVRTAVDTAVRTAVGTAVRTAVDTAVRTAVDTAVDTAVHFLLRCVQAAGYPEWGGNLWPAWIAWASFFKDVCDLELDDAETFASYQTLSTNNGFFSLFPDFAIVSDRPVHIKRNAAGLLHNEGGPAIEWRDGWTMYCWHGQLIPPSHHWIITHRERIQPETIELERNAELRRIMLEIYGFERYCETRGARVIAQDELHGFPRRLMEFTLAGDPVRVIEVTNGSLEPDGRRRKFHLGALRNADTPHEAIAASYGIAPNHYREAVRT